MKKLLMIAVATTAILPMAAQADETTNSTINLSAKAPRTCQVRGIKADLNDKSFQDGKVTFADAVDKDNATATATTNGTTPVYLKLDAFCNYADHAVSLESKHGGMIYTGVDTPTEGNFLKRIGYRVLISDWDPASNIDEFAATGPSYTNIPESKSSITTITKAVNKPNAKIRITSMVASAADANTPLLAGDYTDVLTIKLGATL